MKSAVAGQGKASQKAWRGSHLFRTYGDRDFS